MEKFSLNLLPILLAYLTLITLIDCFHHSYERGRHNRGPRNHGSPHHGPPNRGPPLRGPPHRGPPQRGFPSHPIRNRFHQDHQNQTIIDTTFVYDSGTIKAGDHLDCKLISVTSVDVKKKSCDNHISMTLLETLQEILYVPVLKDANCFSFKLRADDFTVLTLSNITAYNDVTYDVGIHLNDISYISKNLPYLTSVKTPLDITNGKELKPFWIRYANNLVEVGKGTESEPFMKYQFTEANALLPSIDYVGLACFAKNCEWVIDADPVCGINNRTVTPTQPKSQVKTVCKVKNG